MGGLSNKLRGLSGGEIENQTAATTAPTVNDDNTKGYTFNSAWYDSSAGKLYILVDETTGAAIWVPVNGENYKGSWNASTNIPLLADGVGTVGDNYLVSVAGSQNLGSGTIVFVLGDLIIYDGTIWKKGGVSYTPEDVANKSTDGTMAANSATLYPSQSAVVTYASAKVADSITDGVTTVAPSQNAVFDALALKQSTSAKDATGGYAGLTLFKINFKNVANTFTSFFTNSNTAARTYTFQDRDGTILDSTDLSTLNTSIATKQSTSAKDATGGYAGLTLFKINFKNAANTAISFFTNSNTAPRTYTFQNRDGNILDDTDLGTINLALSVKQDSAPILTGLAATSIAVDEILYGSGVNTFSTTTLTSAARTVLDDATVAAMVNTLGGATSTGSGGLVRANSPALTGTAAGLSIGGNAATATTATTATTANTVITNANLTGAVTSIGNAALLGSFTSAQLLAALSTKTGTGNSVFATSPTLVTPALGTPVSGNLVNCVGYSGDNLPIGVSIQTLHTIKTDTATTTSSTYAAISGISRAITPIDVNSKIRITVVLQVGGVANSRANFRLFRGATQIAFANAAPSRTQDTACFSSGGNSTIGSLVMETLDSPATTASITYTVQWASADNVSPMYLNRTLNDTALATFSRTVSTIILSEIKG